MRRLSRRKPRPPSRAIAPACLLAVLSAAVFALPTSATSGTLILTSDTTLTEDHQGNIIIDADGITLDCAGHRILGSGEQAGIFVQYRTGVTIRNCQASGFLDGFFVARSSQVWLEGNQSNENNEGFHVALSDHVRASDNTATANLQNGFVLSDSTDSVFSENRSMSNGHRGFVLSDSDGNSLSDNVAEDNMGFGFHVTVSDDNSLEENVSRRNDTGFGVDDSSGNVVKGNHASDNRSNGFLLTRVRLSRLSGNTAIGNAGDGFRVEQSVDVEFYDNVAEANGQYEIGVEESSNVNFREVASAGDAAGPGSIRLYTIELVSFVGLASTIWLGLYLVGQPRRRPVSWLTALTLWSVAGVFLEGFMGFNQPAVGFVQQIRELFGFWPGVNEVLSRLLVLGWVSKFAVVFWYHATYLMRPGGMTRRRKALLVVGYGLSSTAAMIQILRPEWLATTGALVPIFAASLMIFTALCLVNLVEAVRGARSEIELRQFVLLVAATILASLSGLVFVVGEWFGRPFPPSARTALLWLAVVLLGYGVANYSAIVEGRTIRRQFNYSLVAVGLVTLLYIVVSYLSSVSFGVRTAVFAFVILLAVVTHSLLGNARALGPLRRFPSSVGEGDRLEERLSIALDYLCTTIRASYGLVLLVSDHTVQLAASYHWSRSKDIALTAESLAPDDILPLEPGTFPPPLEGAALLAPLYLDTEHVGAVLLGHPVNGTRYAPDEVDLTGYATDRIVEIIRAKRLEDEALLQIGQVPQVVSPLSGLTEGEPSIATVENALRRMHDLAYLGSCPLAQLRAVRARVPPASATHVDLGRAVHQVLVKAIEKLKPEGQRPTLPSPREWHHYMVLHEAYVTDRPNRDVMAELYISEGTFNRRRREAIEAVTRILREQEEGEEAA
jgi:parallel beta-helix repeat protein